MERHQQHLIFGARQTSPVNSSNKIRLQKSKGNKGPFRSLIVSHISHYLMRDWMFLFSHNSQIKLFRKRLRVWISIIFCNNNRTSKLNHNSRSKKLMVHPTRLLLSSRRVKVIKLKLHQFSRTIIPKLFHYQVWIRSKSVLYFKHTDWFNKMPASLSLLNQRTIKLMFISLVTRRISQSKAIKNFKLWITCVINKYFSSKSRCSNNSK